MIGNRIIELKEKIEESNKLYREGTPIISDKEYDMLMEELEALDSSDELLKKVGFDIQNRKEKLPIKMGSMNKEKSIEELKDWFRLKNISIDEELIITPKYDGLSLCVDELSNSAWTRGDGEIGQRSDPHYNLMSNKLSKKHQFRYTYGEVIMKKETFVNKYSEDFANPRNLVSGLLNSKEISNILIDCEYIKYGAIGDDNLSFKSEILDSLNENQESRVPYHKTKLNLLTEELLVNLFEEYSKEYEIDGLIIEINSLSTQKRLGREKTSNNPIWARAFKSELFEKSEISEVNGISWNISKEGKLKPTVHINPVKLDGVTISNVTGNNARYIKEMGIGIGSKVKIVRSGMVIPKIIEVIERVDFSLPEVGYEIKWDESGVELITTEETDEQKLKRIISFFSVLECENFSEGVITQVWNSGYRNIKSILNMKISDFEKLDGFGKRKSKIVYESIQKSIKSVKLSKLQHASGLFKGLGSLKLVKLEHFKEKPTLSEVMSIEGFAEKSALSYIESYDAFFDFIKDLPIGISKEEDSENISGDLNGKVFVFTGVRLKNIEEILSKRGAKIGSSVSKNTTHLICKDPNSGSSKLEKAKTMGVEIMSVEELENFLKI